MGDMLNIDFMRSYMEVLVIDKKRSVFLNTTKMFFELECGAVENFLESLAIVKENMPECDRIRKD